jgi:hypothetical protein
VSGSGRGPTRLVGVYHADGGLRGEAAYVLGHLFGRAHCSLCDVTHSPLRRKPAWDAMVARLGIRVDLVHLNERDERVAAASAETPCVLAEVDGHYRVLLGRADLDALGGDVTAFEAAVRTALDRLGRVA